MKYPFIITILAFSFLITPSPESTAGHESPYAYSVNLENELMSDKASPITVYVLDSGYNFKAELPDSVVSFTSIDFTEKNGSINQFIDCGGHGTVVSSVLAEEATALSISVNLYSLKVFGCENTASVTDTVGIYRGLNWILENTREGDRGIINMSLSFAAGSEELEVKVAELVERGFTIITSAGNNGDDACQLSPGRMDGVITVGNIRIKPSNNESVVIESSNFGDCVDIYSRGTYMCQVSDRIGQSCSGTSFSAPIISAKAAYYFSNNPHLTSKQVLELLKLDSEYSAVGNYYYLSASENTIEKRYYSILEVESSESFKTQQVKMY